MLASDATPDAKPGLAVGTVPDKLPAGGFLGALDGRHLGDEESTGLDNAPFREGREHRGVAAFLAQGVGRIGEGDVEAGAGVGGQVAVGVGADDFGDGRFAEGLDVTAKHVDMLRGKLDEGSPRRAAGDRLEADGASTGEEIEEGRARDFALEHGEEGLANAILGRAYGVRLRHE